jgi:hypothetical protein
MWIYDIKTKHFLSVNQAAIDLYNFTKEEFLSISLKDIRSKEEVDKMNNLLLNLYLNTNKMGNWIHHKKSGELLVMEIMSFNIFLKKEIED